MRIRQGFPPSPTRWSLGHGLCITFITNGTGRAQLFRFLHLKLWPFFSASAFGTFAFDHRVSNGLSRFCIKRRHLPLFIGANGTCESLLLIWILIQLRDPFAA